MVCFTCVRPGATQCSAEIETRRTQDTGFYPWGDVVHDVDNFRHRRGFCSTYRFRHAYKSTPGAPANLTAREMGKEG